MNPLVLSQIEPEGWYQQTEIANLTGVKFSTVYRWLRRPNNNLPFSIRNSDGVPVVKGRHLIKFLSPKY